MINKIKGLKVQIASIKDCLNLMNKGNYKELKNGALSTIDRLEKQLKLCVVIDSCRFNKDDLLKAYQAGCIEGQDDCVAFGYDDLKETIQASGKWYERYTNKGN